MFSLIQPFSSHRRLHGLTFLVMTCAFSLMFAIQLGGRNLMNWFGQWGAGGEISVYLNDGLEKSQIDRVEKALGQLTLPHTHRFVSKEAAAKDFLKRLGHLIPAQLLESSEGNPLPNSFHIKVSDESSLVGDGLLAVQEFAKATSKVPGVEDVSYGLNWMKEYSGYIRAFQTLGYICFTLVLVVTFLIVSNVIKSSISERSDEIEVLELFGAQRALIQAPYLAEGALLGVSAVAMSLLILLVSTFVLESLVLETSHFSKSLIFFGPFESLGFLILGGGVGLVSSYFSVSKKISPLPRGVR